MILAVPAVFSMFALVTNNIVDTALVGHLGDSQLAAVGSAGFVIWILLSIIDVFSVGTVALIAQDYGAKNLAGASEKAMHILRFAFIFSIFLGIAGIFLSSVIIGALNLAPEVEKMGRVYLMIIFMAVPFIFVGEVGGAIFRAIGDTTTPMIIMFTVVGVNIILNIFLVYGVWIFPRLETMGSAIATATAHTLGTFMGLAFVLKGKIPFRILPSISKKIDFGIIWRMTKIGAPVSLSGGVFAAVYLVMTRIMSEFGTSAVASIPVGNRAESISFMTCFGFYMATSAMVGQNLGGNQPERAKKAAWTSLGIISIVTLFFGSIFYFFNQHITSIFTTDPEVIKNAGSYLRILAISQVFMGFEIVLEGAFAGAGNTFPPMAVSIPGTLLRIPLAYYFAITLGMGPVGIFWAITISTIIKGTTIMFWFRSVRWQKRVY